MFGVAPAAPTCPRSVAQEVLTIRERLNIEVSGEVAGVLCFKPVRSFLEASFPANVLDACRCVVVKTHKCASDLARKEISSSRRPYRPSAGLLSCGVRHSGMLSMLLPCMKSALPGYDLIGIAATGSGKTLAFVSSLFAFQEVASSGSDRHTCRCCRR